MWMNVIALRQLVPMLQRRIIGHSLAISMRHLNPKFAGDSSGDGGASSCLLAPNGDANPAVSKEVAASPTTAVLTTEDRRRQSITAIVKTAGTNTLAHADGQAQPQGPRPTSGE